MNTIESIPSELQLTEPWAQKGSSNWLAAAALDVRKLATLMKDRKARFITITATELPEHGGIVMDYHWDLDGQLLSFEVHAENNQVQSIYDLCEAANWIEREIHEYFAVEFLGREYEPLMLRTGDKMGVNLREEEEE
jgi:NADH:ubiquinone oxidoreductase subunit C